MSSTKTTPTPTSASDRIMQAVAVNYQATKHVLELIEPTDNEKSGEHPIETIQGLLETQTSLLAVILDEVRTTRADIEAIKAIFEQLETG